MGGFFRESYRNSRIITMSSIALYEETSQLRFWNESDIETREALTRRIFHTIRDSLLRINKAWQFERVEGPLLIPRKRISDSYGPSDLWLTDDPRFALRAETTSTTYEAAKKILLEPGLRKPPLCVWQLGKSFRKESNDGASASRMRYFEFYQLEFQCIYSNSTLADYRGSIVQPIAYCLEDIVGLLTQVVPSDRLPSYSEKTEDIEAFIGSNKWIELCSISTRTDFDANHKVLEIAIGMDRLMDIRSLL